MQYMFLIYLDEAKFADMTQAERDAFGNGMLDYDEVLKASGHFILGEPLKPPAEAITLRALGRAADPDRRPLHGDERASFRLHPC